MSTASNRSSAADPEKSAGVGILFVQEEEASGFVRVIVKALIHGGAAEKEGSLEAGDMVVKVDGRDVIGTPLNVLKTIIPGPPGTKCTMGFLRGGVAASGTSTERGHYFDVILTRSNIRSVSRGSTAASRSNSRNKVARQSAPNSATRPVISSRASSASSRNAAVYQRPQTAYPSYARQQQGAHRRAMSAGRVQGQAYAAPANRSTPNMLAKSQSFMRQMSNRVARSPPPAQFGAPRGGNIGEDDKSNMIAALRRQLSQTEKARRRAEEQYRKEKEARESAESRLHACEARLRSLLRASSPSRGSQAYRPSSRLNYSRGRADQYGSQDSAQQSDLRLRQQYGPINA